ncbi:hypothetical protein HAX54_026148 [Datura stramonium]|uniref:Uncharacterized protein n=1 Tax=Datura stramonium TaxID=4076 RepID=A0ABS8V3S7_DATST|nr:hypothetical protein [Datura stramonium]
MDYKEKIESRPATTADSIADGLEKNLFGLILGPDSPSVDEPCGGTLHNGRSSIAPGGLLASVYHLTRIEDGVDQPEEGAVSYAPLLVQRQFESQLFIPQTFGLDQLEFDYGAEDSIRKVCQPNLVTPEYVVCRSERVNGGIVLPFDVTEAFNVFFRLPSEAEIVRQEFYTKRLEDLPLAKREAAIEEAPPSSVSTLLVLVLVLDTR